MCGVHVNVQVTNSLIFITAAFHWWLHGSEHHMYSLCSLQTYIMYLIKYLAITIYFSVMSNKLFTIPYTIHHTPYTIHHTPYTIHHTPYTIHHTPYTIHHTPHTTHHTPHTTHHTPHTTHHTPHTTYHTTPYHTIYELVVIPTLLGYMYNIGVGVNIKHAIQIDTKCDDPIPQ